MEREKNLFVFAHPDDETIVAGLIYRLNKAEEKELYCLWLTDIDATESKKAMSVLGVDENKLIFLPNSTKGIYCHIKGGNEKNIHYFFGCIEQTFLAVINRIKPAKVYVDAFEGGNMTHDLTNFLVKKTVDNSALEIKLIEFPQYHYEKPCKNIVSDNKSVPVPYVGRFYPFNKSEGQIGLNDTAINMKDGAITLNSEELEMKFSLESCYPSQTDQLKLMLETYKPGIAKIEIFREIPKDRDYTKKPGCGEIFYEVYTRAVYGDDGVKFDPHFVRIVRILDKK